MDDITSFIDNSHAVNIVTIDFAKVFDTISHNKQSYKLQTCGICSKVKLWIKEFLFDRSFKVTLDNTSSKEYNITSSVPQGSKLAPLLYILYANDIAKIFTFAKVKMYTDYFTVYAIVNSNEDKNKFQNELNELINNGLIIGN